MPRVDVHQHLWPEALLDALARRARAPRLRRSGAGWVLELAGEPPAVLDLAEHDVAARTALLERDGFDRALIAPSAPLGIETLPPAEAAPLQDAFNAGILELGGPFGLWAALAPGAGPGDVDAVLDAGAIGVCLSAARLAGPATLVAHAPLLTRLAARGAPLFVHPGAAASAPGAPPWWAAMTAYVAEISAAWHAWAAWGRPAHPRLTVVWAMLAGGAPLHSERLAARGGPAHAALNDPRSSFDVSSYGTRAVDAMLRIVGVDRLLYGSDRPVAAPPVLDGLGPAVFHALAEVNPARLVPSTLVPA
jgi:hypothetical protein